MHCLVFALFQTTRALEAYSGIVWYLWIWIYIKSNENDTKNHSVMVVREHLKLTMNNLIKLKRINMEFQNNWSLES